MSTSPSRHHFPTTLVATVLALQACSDPTAPQLPADAVQIAPLPPYRTWWALMESCSGITGHFNDVTWFTSVSGSVGGRIVAGYWFSNGNRILLQSLSAQDGGTVRHEMLHALTQSGAHPPHLFLDRCGPLVLCDEECAVREADRGVPPDAIEVSSTDLSISASVEPNPVSLTTPDSGWFRMRITVTNAAPYPIWVRISPGRQTYGFTATEHGGPVRLTQEPRWAFRAGESRTHVLDARFEVGEWELQPFFDLAHAPPVALSVLP